MLQPYILLSMTMIVVWRNTDLRESCRPGLKKCFWSDAVKPRIHNCFPLWRNFLIFSLLNSVEGAQEDVVFVPQAIFTVPPGCGMVTLWLQGLLNDLRILPVSDYLVWKWQMQQNSIRFLSISGRVAVHYRFPPSAPTSCPDRFLIFLRKADWRVLQLPRMGVPSACGW